MTSTSGLRNVAIIAHVDHGKTTLVDQLFRQSGTFRDNQRVEERAMDSNDLEKERGITILAKCTSVEWKGTRINIVDTPGHADFGGEVERILSMVDGVILLVDSSEGAMPQTKFVTGKALALGLKPIVVVNKIDRPDARAEEVLDEVFDLFVSLDADDGQLEFPTLYASGRNGYAGATNDVREGDLSILFDTIISHVPPPHEVDPDAPFTFLATLLDRDNFLGRILTGRVQTGVLKMNQPIHAIDATGKIVETGRATKIMAFRGLERVPVESASAGDIISLAGLTAATVANTIADPQVTVPIRAQPIDPPTLSMRFAVNDSPMAGREGDKVTSRMIRDRLFREAESNVAIKVTESADKDSFEVAGRGELQLGVLIETMRREGFELGISRPRVLFREGDGGREEPYENCRHRRGRRIFGRRRREDGAAQGRDDGHAPIGRRQDPHHLLGALAWPHRLSWRVPVRYARHRHHEPAVREIRALQGHDRGSPERRPHLERFGRGGGLRAQRIGGARHPLRVAGRADLRGHW